MEHEFNVNWAITTHSVIKIQFFTSPFDSTLSSHFSYHISDVPMFDENKSL